MRPFSCLCLRNGIWMQMWRWHKDAEVNSEMVQGQRECVNCYEQDLGMLQGLMWGALTLACRPIILGRHLCVLCPVTFPERGSVEVSSQSLIPVPVSTGTLMRSPVAGSFSLSTQHRSLMKEGAEDIHFTDGDLKGLCYLLFRHKAWRGAILSSAGQVHAQLSTYP